LVWLASSKSRDLALVAVSRTSRCWVYPFFLLLWFLSARTLLPTVFFGLPLPPQSRRLFPHVRLGLGPCVGVQASASDPRVMHIYWSVSSGTMVFLLTATHLLSAGSVYGSPSGDLPLTPRLAYRVLVNLHSSYTRVRWPPSLVEKAYDLLVGCFLSKWA